MSEIRRTLAGAWRSIQNMPPPLIAIGSILLVIGVFYLIALWWLTPPALPRDMHGTVAEKNVEFSRRIHRRFAPGDSPEDLIRTLRRAGFHQVDDTVMRRDPRLPCAMDYYVSWTLDADARIEDIDAVGSVTCF